MLHKKIMPNTYFISKQKLKKGNLRKSNRMFSYFFEFTVEKNEYVCH